MTLRSFSLFAACLFAAGTLQAQTSELVAANQQKLYAITLPDLNFQNMPVALALKKIHALANTSPDPAKRVNFSYQPASFGAATVTLVMMRPSLNHALDEIATQANLMICPQEFCIAILPRPSPTPAPSPQ